MDIEKIHARLQKLLALSASPNEREALAAMEMCKKLMAKYNIRSVDVDLKTKTANISSLTIPGYSRQRSLWQIELGASIAACFDGKCITSKFNDGSWKLTFIATNTEMILIKDLFIRLRRIIGKMSSIYADSRRGNRTILKNSYAHGVVEIIYWRLKEIYKTMKPEDSALVLVKEDSVNKYAYDLFPNLHEDEELKKNTIASKLAYREGLLDGAKVNLSRSLNGAEGNHHIEGG